MTAKVQASAVVLVSRSEDGTVTICDANGKVRDCSSPDSCAQALAEVMDDPSLPKIEDVPPHQANMEEAVVASVKEVLPPFLKPFVRPGLQGIGQWFKSMSHRTAPFHVGRRRRRRYTPPTSTKGKAA